MNILLESYKDYQLVESLPIVMSDGSVRPSEGIWFSRTVKVRQSNGEVHLETVHIPIEQLIEEVTIKS